MGGNLEAKCGSEVFWSSDVIGRGQRGNAEQGERKGPGNDSQIQPAVK